MSGTLPVPGAGAARTLVRADAPSPGLSRQDSLALGAVGAGALGVALIAAAALRRRRRGAPEGSRALRELASGLKLGRAACAEVERLALAAQVREPAVLVLSRHAFWTAVEAAQGAPSGRGIDAARLARSLGFDAAADGGRGGS